ncbi:MAG: LPS-assembly protein LptD [Dysgonamonadaceae bacterium]|nr:LPS-assembly protein LptD [Dysgonamonadaceae bacterium]
MSWFVLTWLTCPMVSGQALDSIQPIHSIQPVDTIQTVTVTDTIPKNANAVDAPVRYASKDSMVMVMKGQNKIYMYGEGSVQYKNLDLTGEYIEVDANNSVVYATFALDSIGEEFGYPVYKEGETQYEMKKARYNFNTKKMYVNDVITQQGDGFMTAGQTKKMANDDLYLKDGRYSTCDDHEHQHFYLHITKGKLRPGKDVVVGPAYLVVEDVPLPIALPFAFFPLTNEYSSGIIMPSYGDELKRGFSLQNGGYYFAMSDYMDMKLTGEIFTRGSWGLDAVSNYKKLYKFSGNLQASYRVTILGEKDEKDYSKSKDIKLSWTHTQDQRANPFGTFSANVNFSTSSYSQNDLNSLYSGQASHNTASSNISYNYRPPGSAFSFSANASVNQVKRDTSLSVTLPNLTITMREIYPFQRKERVGALRWYENIRMSYTGVISNSIQNAKEYEFMKKNLIGDWKNGMQHRIPVSASFNFLKNITITPSMNYEERWYTTRIDREYDYQLKRDVPADTVTGFYRIYNYSASVSAQTKIYGMFKPWRMFGKWTEKTDIRHVFTPSVSFSGAPDFSDKKYGYYKDIVYENEGRMETITYSPYAHNMWGVPGRGQSGTLNFSIDNNIEMKIPMAGTDSTRKISLIDQLRLSTSYNFLADSMRWSNLNASLRLKLFKNYSLTLSGIFDIYEYDENGRQINSLKWKKGSIGRFRGTSQTVSFSLNNETLKKWFGKKDSEGSGDTNPSGAEGTDPSQEEGADGVGPESDLTTPTRTSLRKSKEKDGNYDDDGYYLVNIPWNLNVNYSFGFAYDMQNFNKEKRIYPYKITQNLGLSGNISPTKGWNFTFNTGYDFDNKQFTPTQLSISRQMHCWSMSASVIPVGPYQSYSFTIAVNSSLLQDLKYTQSSNYYDSMNWGY